MQPIHHVRQRHQVAAGQRELRFCIDVGHVDSRVIER
jgi:hypothetical protein